MSLAWPRAGYELFQGNAGDHFNSRICKKRSDDGKDLNIIIASTIDGNYRVISLFSLWSG